MRIFKTGQLTIFAPSQEKIRKAVEHTYRLVEPFQEPTNKFKNPFYKGLKKHQKCYSNIVSHGLKRFF